MMTSDNPIKLFTATFHGSYHKLSPTDVDYRIHDKDGKHIAYAIVEKAYNGDRIDRMASSYPLKVSARRLSKLIDKRYPAVVIWQCDDGIIYGKPTQIEGAIRWDGNDLICYFEKQKGLKYIRYE